MKKNAFAITALLLLSSAFPQAMINVDNAVAQTPPYISQDPCNMQKKTTFTLPSAQQSNTALTQLIGGVNGQTIYICSILVKPNAATAFSLIEGTGSNCAGPPQSVVVGSLIAASGIPFSGLGDGFSMAPGGTVWAIANLGNALCFQQSISENLSITIGFVQTPL